MTVLGSLGMSLDLLCTLKSSLISKTYIAQDSSDCLLAVKIYKCPQEVLSLVSSDFFKNLFDAEGQSSLAKDRFDKGQILQELETIIKPTKVFTKTFHDHDRKTVLVTPYFSCKSLGSIESLDSFAKACKLLIQILDTLSFALHKDLLLDPLDEADLLLSSREDLKITRLEYFKPLSSIHKTHREFLSGLVSVFEKLLMKVPESHEVSKNLLEKLRVSIKEMTLDISDDKISQDKSRLFFLSLFQTLRASILASDKS